MRSEPDSIHNLLVSAGLPGDFVDKLIHESDWSLVIKLHALFEAVLANLLVRKLGTKAIDDVIAHLDFNNTKSGKVAFARALGLLESREVAFLRGLSELRNRLVHDVRNVSFDLRAHVEQMTESQRKKFKSEFGAMLCSTKSGESSYARHLAERPAFIILSAAYGCLLVLYFNIEDQQRNMLVEALMRASKE
jgi:hypothetical protein